MPEGEATSCQDGGAHRPEVFAVRGRRGNDAGRVATCIFTLCPPACGRWLAAKLRRRHVGLLRNADRTAAGRRLNGDADRSQVASGSRPNGVTQIGPGPQVY